MTDSLKSLLSSKIAAVIDGQKVIRSEYHLQSTNPSDQRDVVGLFGEATLQDCEEAADSAGKAFEKWSLTPAPVRADIIQNFGTLLRKNKESLARLVTREMGKPIREARGDVQEAIDTCVFFASEGRRLYGQTIPSEMPSKDLFTFRKPLGVFACITAGNFPVAVPSWYFVPALVCGNTCIWKPSEETSAVSLAFFELLRAAGIPDGVFHVLFGRGPQTGASLVSLVEKGKISKIGFTGSSAVGRTIGEICGRNLQTPCLELGGKNPMIIMPDADLELAAHGALWSAYGTAGQRCTSLGNLILHKKIKEKFLNIMQEKINEIKIGDPFLDNITYGPLMGERFLNDHIRHLETLIKPQHKLLTDLTGRIPEGTKKYHFCGDAKNGIYAFPVLVNNVTKDDLIYSTETFGPLVNILDFDDFDDAISLANGTGYGLSSSIYTNSPHHVFRFKERIQAGMVSINNSTTGAEAHLPFGGNGKSGNGSRQSGIWVLDQFTRWQAVNWDTSGKLQLAQMDTGYISPKDYTLNIE